MNVRGPIWETGVGLGGDEDVGGMVTEGVVAPLTSPTVSNASSVSVSASAPSFARQVDKY